MGMYTEMRSATHIYELRHTKIFREQCVVHDYFLKFDVFKVCRLSKMVCRQTTSLAVNPVAETQKPFAFHPPPPGRKPRVKKEDIQVGLRVLVSTFARILVSHPLPKFISKIS